MKEKVKYRAVLFDLDGTLLDTLNDISTSANRVLSRFHFPQHEREAYKYFVGDGMKILVTRILPAGYRDEKTVNEVLACVESEYRLHWADTTRPYEGIPELLHALTSQYIKIAVLSNKPDEITKLSVVTLLSKWRFETILGVRPLVPKKPDPAAALEIAAQISISPGEFLYLGDTAVDMKTAEAAGMFPVGALWGFRTADELTNNGAKELISKPVDLLKILQ